MYHKKVTLSVTGMTLWNSIENYIKNSKAVKTKFKCFFIFSYLDIAENANKRKIEEITACNIKIL